MPIVAGALANNVWAFDGTSGHLGTRTVSASTRCAPESHPFRLRHSLLFRTQTSSFTGLKTAPKSRHSFVEVQRCRRFAVCSGFEIAHMLEIGTEPGLGRAPSEPQ